VRDSLLPNVPIFGRKLLLGKRRENAEHHSLTMRNKLSISNCGDENEKKTALTKYFQKKIMPQSGVFSKIANLTKSSTF